jgi:hypothetical protein
MRARDCSFSWSAHFAMLGKGLRTLVLAEKLRSENRASQTLSASASGFQEKNRGRLN